jgi:hypothetical protein
VYEVDQSAVIEFKRKTLARLGAEPIATLRTIGVDLQAWLAEGLLIYLPPEAPGPVVEDGPGWTETNCSGGTDAPPREHTDDDPLGEMTYVSATRSGTPPAAAPASR